MAEQSGDRCAVCGGGLIPKLITHEIPKGGELLVFDNVPAFVCAQCDGVWISAEVKQKLEEIVQRETREES